MYLNLKRLIEYDLRTQSSISQECELLIVVWPTCVIVQPSWLGNKSVVVGIIIEPESAFVSAYSQLEAEPCIIPEGIAVDHTSVGTLNRPREQHLPRDLTFEKIESVVFAGSWDKEPRMRLIDEFLCLKAKSWIGLYAIIESGLCLDSAEAEGSVRKSNGKILGRLCESSRRIRFDGGRPVCIKTHGCICLDSRSRDC